MERDESKTTRHESFGTIKAHRIVGHSGFMYGSDVKLDSFIQIEITKNSSVEYDRVYWVVEPILQIRRKIRLSQLR